MASLVNNEVGGKNPSALKDSQKIGKIKGRQYSCEFDKKQVGGLTSLVLATVMVIFATILATGVFGGGTMAFIAGGLSIASMAAFGLGAYLLIPPPPVIGKAKLGY
jgi:hypothetical protein